MREYILIYTLLLILYIERLRKSRVLLVDEAEKLEKCTFSVANVDDV